MEVQKLTAPDATANARFGAAIAAEGDTAVIGAPNAQVDGTNRGAAYVFQRNNSDTWSQVARLVANDGSSGDLFGAAVAINNNTIVVGAAAHNAAGGNAGAAYIFTYDGATWSQTAKLLPSRGGDVRFGATVALDANTIAVGAPYSDSGFTNSGSVYVFENNSGLWQETRRFSTNNGGAVLSDLFGWSVGLKDDLLVVGAYLNSQVHLYNRTNNNWQQALILKGNDTQANDRFGFSVATDGNRIIVGATHDSSAGSNAGSAFIFHQVNGTWTQETKLLPTSLRPLNGANFGSSVAILGNIPAVGALNSKGIADLEESGATYAYMFGSTGWQQSALLTASDAAEFDHLGTAVAISPTALLIGAPDKDTDNLASAGAVYVMAIPPSGVTPPGDDLPDTPPEDPPPINPPPVDAPPEEVPPVDTPPDDLPDDADDDNQDQDATHAAPTEAPPADTTTPETPTAPDDENANDETGPPGEIVVVIPLSDIPGLLVAGQVAAAPIIPEFNWIHATTQSPDSAPGEWYNVLVIKDEVPVIDQWFYVEDICTGVNCQAKPEIELYEVGTYSWLVRVWGNRYARSSHAQTSIAGINAISEAASFEINLGHALLPDISVEVGQGQPSIQFANDPNTSWLNVYVGTADLSQHLDFSWYRKDQAQCSESLCTLLLNAHPPRNGSYVVYTAAWGPGGYSQGGVENTSYAGPVYFNVSIGLPPKIGDVTVIQEDENLVTFSFNAVQNTTWYHLEATQGDEVIVNIWFKAAENSCGVSGSACELSTVIPLDAGKSINWRIAPWGPGVVGAREYTSGVFTK